MREQTVVMQASGGSHVFSEIANTAEAALFQGASFVLSLGIAYLAVCYGISIPKVESIEESNP
jgi:hypothetical protein